MEAGDWSLRFRLDPIDLPDSKEHYTKIALEDAKSRLEMATKNHENSADAMTFMMSEKTVEDNIYLKYGLEVQHLREAISRHDLLDVPEIKQMRDGTEKLKK